jgi:hypothetical protein
LTADQHRYHHYFILTFSIGLAVTAVDWSFVECQQNKGKKSSQNKSPEITSKVVWIANTQEFALHFIFGREDTTRVIILL